MQPFITIYLSLSLYLCVVLPSTYLWGIYSRETRIYPLQYTVRSLCTYVSFCPTHPCGAFIHEKHASIHYTIPFTFSFTLLCIIAALHNTSYLAETEQSRNIIYISNNKLINKWINHNMADMCTGMHNYIYIYFFNPSRFISFTIITSSKLRVSQNEIQKSKSIFRHDTSSQMKHCFRSMKSSCYRQCNSPGRHISNRLAAHAKAPSRKCAPVWQSWHSESMLSCPGITPVLIGYL